VRPRGGRPCGRAAGRRAPGGGRPAAGDRAAGGQRERRRSRVRWSGEERGAGVRDAAREAPVATCGASPGMPPAPVEPEEVLRLALLPWGPPESPQPRSRPQRFAVRSSIGFSTSHPARADRHHRNPRDPWSERRSALGHVTTGNLAEDDAHLRFRAPVETAPRSPGRRPVAIASTAATGANSSRDEFTSFYNTLQFHSSK